MKHLYTDTDLFIFSSECEYILEEMKANPPADWIDTFNINPQHPLHDDSYKGKLGFLKSEIENLSQKYAA